MFGIFKHQIRVIKSKLRERKKGRSSKWPAVRKHHLENYPMCAACLSKKNLQVHHIHPYHLAPSRELDPENLITLCMSHNECHLNLGHGDDFDCYVPSIRALALAALAEPRCLKYIQSIAKQERRKK